MTGVDIGAKDGGVYRRKRVHNLCVLPLLAQTRVFQLPFSLCLLLMFFDYRIDDLESGYDVSVVVCLPKIKLVMMQRSALCAAIGAAVLVLPGEHLAEVFQAERLGHLLLVIWMHVFLYPLLYHGVVGKLALHDVGNGPDIVVFCKAHHPCRLAVQVCYEHVFEARSQRVDNRDLLCQRFVLLLLLAYYIVDVVVVPPEHKPAFYRLSRAAAAHIPLAQNGMVPQIGVLIPSLALHFLNAAQNRLQRVWGDVCKPCVVGLLGRQLLALNPKKPQHEIVGFHFWGLPVKQVDVPCAHL